MKRRNLALLELALVILFTALSAAVLVQVFAAARQTSEDSRARTLGQAMAQDLIERWRAGEEANALFEEAGGWQALPDEACAGLLDALNAPEDAELAPIGGRALLLDAALLPATGENTAYRLEAALAEEPQPAGRLCHLVVRLWAVHSGQELFCFAASQYQPGA